MINGIIKGHEVLLRPVRFDSDDYDKNYKKPNGDYIRPIVAITTCPICGGLINQNITINDDLSKQIAVNCDKCAPYVANIVKPAIFTFKNPIKTGALSLWDINPTAMSNICVDASFFDKKEPDIKSNDADPNNIVEMRSEGLGQFLRKKDMWKKSNNSTTIERHVDYFDMVGDMVNETFVKQEDIV